jgi:hypothetical protein
MVVARRIRCMPGQEGRYARMLGRGSVMAIGFAGGFAPSQDETWAGLDVVVTLDGLDQGTLAFTAGQAVAHEVITDRATLTIRVDRVNRPAWVVDASGVAQPLVSGVTVQVNLAAGTQVLRVVVAGVTNAIEATRVVWTMADAEVEEGDTATFHVVRTDGGKALTVRVHTEDGTAIAGTDYTAVDDSSGIDGTDDLPVAVVTTLRAGTQGDRTADLVVEVTA